MHIVHEELRGSLPGNPVVANQQLNDDATLLTGQRYPQCIVSDLAFYVISI